MILDGRKIQNEIAMRKMTLTDFAKQAQLPTATVHRAIEGGNSSLRTAGKIAAALQISPSELRAAFGADTAKIIESAQI